jgi:type IV pilus assembly protein PilE
MTKRSKAQGFTLIEVMIVVAIIAILSMVALPAYTDYVRRGKLPEAFTHLSDYRIKLEQYYQDNRSYGTGGAGTACANAAGAPTWSNFNPGAKYFTFSCSITAAAGQGYTLTATGIGGANDHVYTLTSAGVKGTTRLKGATVAKTCWATKAGDC